MKSAKTAASRGYPKPPKRAHLGSEYMDAQSYLTQPTRAPKVKLSDPTFHGSNDSDYGAEPKGIPE